MFILVSSNPINNLIMKKLLAFAAIVAISFMGCKKDDDNSGTPTGGGGGGGLVVEEKNMGLYNKLTATWCGPCGQWGWTLNETIITAVEANAVVMGTYADNGTSYNNTLFYNSTAAGFKSSFSPSSGWPDFCANGKQKTQFSGSGGIYSTQTKDSVIATINNHVAAEVKANSAFTYTIDGDTLTIIARAKFFKDMNASSAYYLGAYIIEDDAMAPQNGITNNTTNTAHHHVLRGSASNSTWGELITSPSTTGSTFDFTFKKVLPATWNKANLEVATIIWEKVGSTYKFVNANKN